MSAVDGALVESIEEVLANAEATQGEEFVYCVATLFESAQLAEVLVGLFDRAGLKPDDGLPMACFELLHSLADKALPDLEEDKFIEATKVADKLIEIRRLINTTGPSTLQ
jgi:hypothetical protein